MSFWARKDDKLPPPDLGFIEEGELLIRRRRTGSPRSRLAGSAIVLLLSALLTVCARLPLRGDSEPQNSLRTSLSGHYLVVLLDINPNQKKVLPVELALAEGVIRKVGQPGNAFSVITFGSPCQPARSLCSRSARRPTARRIPCSRACGRGGQPGM